MSPSPSMEAHDTQGLIYAFLKPVFLAVLLCAPLGKGLCFPDGIPESERVNLTNGGESYSVGMWVPTWAAGVSASAVMEILAQEKLGFHVVKGGSGSTTDGFFAMAGCVTPTDTEDRGCGAKQTYYHIHLEGWTAGYLPLWKKIQEDYPETAPQIVGSMGYKGLAGQYIPRAIIEDAYAQDGVSLGFYRGHNASWFDLSKYFDDIHTIDASKHLLPCNETRMMDTEAQENYLQVTGDWDGVDNSTGQLVAKCFSGHYWLAPSCRADPTKCYAFISAGTGYGFEHWQQKATIYHMPLAFLVGKEWNDYTQLPKEVKSTFYWWQPDPTFLSLDAVRVVFEPFDAEESRRGILLSDGDMPSIDKYASNDLQVLAPRMLELLKAFNIDLKVINKLMAEHAETGDAPEVVACRWLKANEDLVETWMPDPTKCFPQFGLYNENTKKFVEDRADPTGLTCRACDSGFYSQVLKDGDGVTHVCTACRLGTMQPSGASLDCNLCPTGEYQDEPGSASCKRCGQGKYQDLQGQSYCQECPAATTTLGLGSVSVSECGCELGSINIADGNESAVCTPCGTGLICPFSSSLHTFKMGQAPLGEKYQPALQEGFWSNMENPLAVFRCIKDSFCPGGKPEICNGGRVGLVCAECPSGQSGAECTACSPESMALWWLFTILFFGTCSSAYYFANPKVSAVASARQSATVSLGLAISWLQTVAIVGMMTVEWPSTVSGTFSLLRLFVLDVDALSFSCFASEQPLPRYLLKVLACPAGMLWMVVLYFLSKSLPARFQWTRTKMINSIGGVAQITFAIMTTVAMESMRCYLHPNGSYSLVQYPAVICGEGEQERMIAAGACLLLLVVGFLVLIIYATIVLPSWSGRMLYERVQCFNFLTYRFRLDRWWFGIILLMRGPLISLVVTLSTNLPAMQLCMNGLILTIYALIQSTARPWKAPFLNWMDFAASILLTQITVISGAGIQDDSKAFLDVYGMCLLLLFACVGVVMGLAAGIALLRELWLKQEAKDSAILRMFESGSAGLSEKFLAIAGAVVDQDLPLQSFLDRMNSHDLSDLENALDLISADLSLDLLLRRSGKLRLHQKTVSARLSNVTPGTDLVMKDANLPALQPEPEQDLVMKDANLPALQPEPEQDSRGIVSHVL